MSRRLSVQQERLISAHRLVYVRLAGYFVHSVHIEHCDTAVYDFHAIFCQYISDGSASSYIYLTQLGSLKGNSCFVEYSAQSRYIFGICVVRAALSPRSREFVKRHASAKIRGILLFKHSRIGRVEPGADV